jgi:hypothetical protein
MVVVRGGRAGGHELARGHALGCIDAVSMVVLHCRGLILKGVVPRALGWVVVGGCVTRI